MTNEFDDEFEARDAIGDGGSEETVEDGDLGDATIGDEVADAPDDLESADGHGGSDATAEVGPSPEHSAADVFDLLSREISRASGDGEQDRGERRRRALQGEDGPYRLAFALASPRLRSEHGDLVAFAAAMTDPITEPLFSADEIERGPAEIDEEAGEAVFTVLARPTSGNDDAEGEDAGARGDDAVAHGAADPRTYDVTLRRQTAGKYAGCWMLEAIELVYVGVSPRFRRMPTVSFAGEAVRCEDGDTLRDVLLEAEDLTPHNDAAQIANCGGNGLCGTCAVEVDGETDEQGRREERRLGLPPFDGEDGLRLSCQTCVRGDLDVSKHDGLWGQHKSEIEDTEATDEGTAANDGPIDQIEVSPAEYGGSFEYDPAALDPNGGDGTADPTAKQEPADDPAPDATDGGERR